MLHVRTPISRLTFCDFVRRYEAYQISLFYVLTHRGILHIYYILFISFYIFLYLFIRLRLYYLLNNVRKFLNLCFLRLVFIFVEYFKRHIERDMLNKVSFLET